ncbi:SLATT domain-containing protein [Stutzerimonas stutzeri]
MEIVRGLSLDERKEFYRQNRIFDQQRWYDAKAKENRRGARFWTAAGVISYLTAGLLVLARIKFTEWGYWPIDPIIVFASSIIGWVQLKKYSELAAAYQVTGQEIGIIEAVLDEHDDEKTIADFVNDAELAFSREHTMWAARNNS